MKIINLISTLLILMFGSNLYSQTPSDDCSAAGASQIQVNCNTVSITASTVIGSPALSGCGATGSRDSWVWFTATSSETVIDYWNPNRDAEIFVYSGSCGSLVNVGCVDDYGSGSSESIIISTVIGDNYFVRLVRYSGTTNPQMVGDLDICPTCTYQLILYDSGCNGWDWADIEVYINGVSAGYGYPSSPQCSITYNLRFYSGDVVELLYHYDGLTDNQNSFKLLDPWGNNVAAGSLNLSGNTWVAYTYPSCIQPSAVANQDQDCGWAQTLCSGATLNGNSSGPGNHYELNLTNTGCLMGEHQATWYFFQAQTAGNIALTLSPTNGTDDYDFAIWNATNCPPTAAPIRCSWAGVAGNTGLGNGAVDVSESADGNSWVSQIAATAGQDYLMLIDNWSGSSSPYTLTWNLSGGASLDCALLPVELLELSGICYEDYITLNWSTSSEKNNDFFTIEKSYDNKNWNFVRTIKGAGTSNLIIKYNITDYIENYSENIFYRLKQTDYNGTEKTYQQILVKCTNKDDIFAYNPFGTDEITINWYGIQGDEADLLIIDYLGNIIYNSKITLITNNDLKTITLNSDLNGIYNVILVKQDKTISKKIVIIK